MNQQHITDQFLFDSHPPGLNGTQNGTAVSLGERYVRREPSDDSLILDQVERILHSDELRGCEALRRLLKFLADKSVCGEADELKEYIVAIDGLGKPSSYDPRKNSTVRIQVGRLRQKLADYYRTEGQRDPVLIDVPKGRFKLKFEYRHAAVLKNGQQHAPAAESLFLPRNGSEEQNPEVKRHSWLFRASLAVAVILGIAIGASLYWIRPTKAKVTTFSYPAGWDADMEALWQPYVATKRPLVVAIEDPLFVELNGNPGVYFRDKELNDWSSIANSPTIAAVKRATKSGEIHPSRYYTAYGEVEASFLIAKLLGPRVQNLTVVKTSNLSLQQLADNNVLFVGVQNIFFTEQTQAAPIDVPLQQVPEGIRNLHPGPNEPALFSDQYSTAPAEEGVAYALITHFPGPMGGNDVESFTSYRSAGYVAAVKAFTNPEFVKPLLGKLKQACGGHLPRYYQIVLKVKFKDDVPTEISFVLARELHLHGES
jgi:hypothetical protein